MAKLTTEDVTAMTRELSGALEEVREFLDDLKAANPERPGTVKANLLKHYSEREPKEFEQIDGWLVDGGDCVMTPDEDGHWFSACITTDLMHGSNVRVLITPGTPREEVRSLLEKIKTKFFSEEASANKPPSARDEELDPIPF